MKKSIVYRTISAVLSAIVLIGCSAVESTHIGGSEGPAIIYPDYKDVTIPVNIAPLNYYYAMKGATSAVTTFTAAGRSITIKGVEVEWSLGKWKEFIAQAAGQTVEVKASVKVEGKTIEDSWKFYVIEDKVDW
mgnify:CR=1 FL=1